MKHGHFSLRIRTCLTAAGLLLALVAQPLQAVHADEAADYTPLVVTPSGAGYQTCRNWANACTLQYALSISEPGNQIWVAKGMYTPGSLRTSSFKPKNGVTIYGGFKGTEIYPGDRNWTTNVTILSGDIGLDGLPSNNAYHVVDISATDPTAILDGFTIRSGTADGSGANDRGAGIYNLGGRATLRNLIITSNTAISLGAGMYNSGVPLGLILTNVTFSYNLAASPALGSHSYGGGMYNDNSSPTLKSVTFNNNKAGVAYSSDGSGGGMFNTANSSPSLTSVTFNGNAAVNGGGMYLNGAGNNPHLNSVVFSQNSAQSRGGGVFNNGALPALSNVTFNSNHAAYGGGLFNTNSGNAKLTKAAFNSNTAGVNGGGMYNNASSPTLTNVTFNSNHAPNGGGLFDTTSSAPALIKVTLSGNTANYGAGVYNIHSSSPSLTDATFTANSANNDGGAMYNKDSSSPTVNNATFTGNSALSGGSMFNSTSNPAIKNSIFWADGYQEIRNFASSPTISYSLVDGGCPTTGTPICTNIYQGNPSLGPLQNNGDFTQTMALGGGSAALDKGNNATCAGYDQRGVSRPQGPKCDLGAYEVRFKSFQSVGTYDGWVLEHAKGSNTGDIVNSSAAALQVGDDALNRRYRGFLSFNTSALPDNATIVVARLKVRQAAAPTGNPFGTQGSLLVDLAAPSFGGSLSLVSSDWQANPTVTAAGTFGKTPVSGWYNSVLNATARSKVSKTSTTQFRLRFGSENYNSTADYLSLNSGNAITSYYWPVLSVYYNP